MAGVARGARYVGKGEEVMDPKAQAMHDAIRAFLASIANGTGPGGFDPTIARADLQQSPLVQAMSDAADQWEMGQ
jgi:hypothetical protein